MEIEKRHRDIYNPFLLNVAYQKLYYLDRIRRIYVWRHHRFCDSSKPMDEEEQYRMIRENLCSEQIVADIVQLVESMRREKYPLDIYHCNFEYLLFRLYMLLQATKNGTSSFPAGATFMEDFKPLLIEQKLLEILDHWGDEGKEVNHLLFQRVMEKYIQRFYFVGHVNYESEAIKRTSLLLNIKHQVEFKVCSKEDGDYIIEYNGESIISMMYVFFMNEFAGLLREEIAQLRTTYHTHQRVSSSSSSSLIREEDHQVEFQRKMKQLEGSFALMEELYKELQLQYIEEFQAYSLITAFPESAVGDVASSALRRYIMLVPNDQKTVFRVKDLERDEFVIREKQCHHIRYISLRKNVDHYVYATRKMMFDHELLKDHETECPFSEGKNNEHYTPCCQVCNYLQRKDSLHTLYNVSDSCPYYLCEYVPISKGERPPNRLTRLSRHLETLIIDPITPLESLIYKNAWQAMCIFNSTSLSIEKKNNLFHIININHLLSYINANYESRSNGPDARIDLILRQSQLLSKSSVHVERWQKNLALDIDIFTLLMYAVDAQQSEIEKYERTLHNTRSIATTRPDITKILINIYGIYMTVLDDTMKKVY